MFAKLTVTATLAVLLIALAASALACGGASADDFVGNWQETGATPAHTMQIDAPQDGIFRVTYDRFYPSHGEFELSDGKLTYSAITPDMVDVITYNADDDTLTITSGSSGDSYTLARVTP